MENNTDNSINTTDKIDKKATTTKKKRNKTRKVGKIIINIITTFLFVIIVLNSIISLINMQRINNGEEPIWYLTTKTTETELKTVTEYNLGLYKIVKTDTAKETKTTLKPFFLGD